MTSEAFEQPDLCFIDHSVLGDPPYMHPEDIVELDLADGDAIAVASRHDSIPSLVQADRCLRRGVVAMHHGFGRLAEENDRSGEIGSNAERLIANDVDYDPITGIPRTGNIPLRIARA